MSSELITLLGDVRVPTTNKHFQRIPNEYILYMIRDGHMILVENDITYHLYPGNILLLEPSLLHYGIRVNSLIEYSFIHISLENNLTEEKQDETSEIMKQILMIKKMTFQPELFQNIIQLYEELKKTYHSTSTYRNAKMHSLFNLYLIKLLESQDEFISASENPYLNNTQFTRKLSSSDLSDYLRQNIQKTIRSHDLENAFHHNFDYMNRVFKADIGMTIFQYLEEYRIAEAKKMLQTHAFSISQIAETLGFCNTYYFSRVFKKKTGVAPSHWNNKKYDKNNTSFHQLSTISSPREKE